MDPKLPCGLLYLSFGLFFFFCVWKKAYMSIDANHVSNPKDR